MSSVFFIPICVATVTVGFFVFYICGETDYCRCDKDNSNSDNYESTPCI